MRTRAGKIAIGGAAELERIVSSPTRSILAVLANVPTLLKIGWHEPLVEPVLLWIAQGVLIGLYMLALWREVGGLPSAHRREVFRIIRPELLFGIAALVFVWAAPILKTMCALLVIVHLARLFLNLVQTRVHPGLVFLSSFVLLVCIGTLALLLPAATPRAAPISVMDAAFTITSAISQTGLIVRPTGMELDGAGVPSAGFTRFGQVVILIWIQIGAMGVIVFGALLVNVLGSSFGLRATQTIAEGTEQGWAGQLSLQRLVTFIIVFTHLVELIGAVILYISWPETWEGGPVDMATNADRAFHAIFFSVSGFCNAGFVTSTDSLVGLRVHWTTHLVIAPLIVLGSIGFPVLDNLRRVAWDRIRGVRMTPQGGLVRLNLNTKLVLTTTLALYIMGYAFIFLSETYAGSTAIDPGTAALDAHFMNINRTAGFNSLHTADMGVLSHLGLIFLMFVGGSPGSVAGGIKVMVFAILILTVIATLRGRPQTTAFGRTIPDTLVRKSATLIVLFLILLLMGTGALIITDPEHSLQEHMFEVSSALGTCGLTLGVTGDLSEVGKGVIMFMMFMGRVGPLAVIAALIGATSRKRPHYEYATEEVVIY